MGGTGDGTFNLGIKLVGGSDELIAIPNCEYFTEETYNLHGVPCGTTIHSDTPPTSLQNCCERVGCNWNGESCDSSTIDSFFTTQSEALGFTDFTMTSDLHISHDGQWLPFGWHINSYSLNVSTDQYTPNIKPIAEA